MTPLKQRDPRWKDIQLGKCPGETIGKSGCLITCYAMLSGKLPPEVNSILTKQGGYQMGCLVIQNLACELLGLINGGKTKTPQVTPCIAETNHFAPTVPQHFVIWLGDGQILDPLDGKKKTNPYKIVSYRNITTKKEEPMPQLSYAEEAAKILRENPAMSQFIWLVNMRALETASQKILGEVNQKDRENDAHYVLESQKNGADFTLGKVIGSYYDSEQATSQREALLIAEREKVSAEYIETIRHQETLLAEKDQEITKLKQSNPDTSMTPWEKIQSGVRELLKDFLKEESK